MKSQIENEISNLIKSKNIKNNHLILDNKTLKDLKNDN